jgi:hypothetical protein
VVTISSNNIIEKLSYITKSNEIIFIKDTKEHIIKAVVLPYELYEKHKELIEDEAYLLNNAETLSQESYKDFLEIESVCESNEVNKK